MRAARYPNFVLIPLAIGESGYDVTSAQHIVGVHKYEGTLGSDKGKETLSSLELLYCMFGPSYLYHLTHRNSNHLAW